MSQSIPALSSTILIDDDVDISGYSLSNPGELTTTGNIGLADVLKFYPKDSEGNLLHGEASQKEIRRLIGLASDSDEYKEKGRGSYSTIGKFIKIIEKLDALSRAPILNNDIPSVPKSLIDNIWATAYQHARAEYAARGEVNASKLIIASEKIAVLNKRTNELLTELDNSNEIIESLKAACDIHDSKIADINNAHNSAVAQLNEEINNLNNQITEMKLKHSKEILDAENTLNIERLRWDAAKEAMLADKERIENKMVEMRTLFDKFNPQSLVEKKVDTKKNS